ncbi:MAG: glycosyltransferase family 4 protein [Caulobacter sp.]|nr:glycosyltransferase family 4 protein [Caulobacter sp.]
MADDRDDRPCVAFCANKLFYLANFRRGTIERFLADGVRVVCLGQGGAGAEALEAMGCEVVPLDWKLRSLDPVHELGVVSRISAVLRRVRPTVVFSFTFKANFAVSLACLPLGIPYVTNVSGLGTAFLSNHPKHRVVRRLYGVANGRAHATFFQNPSDLEHFERIKLSIGRRTAVLPGSGVNTEHFAFDPLDRPVRSFVMVARLIAEKGVVEYLEAARRARSSRPDLRFLLVGPPETDGPGRVPLEQVHSYAGDVDYLGELADVRPALREAECLVLPSYREGMPRTVLEAASMGRVSLVSDVEGCRHAVEDGVTGFMFEARSAESLAGAVLSLAERDAGDVAAMSRAASRMAEERFSERLCIEPYLALFEELGGRRR